MELFSEIYSCYYQVTAAILRQAQERAVTAAEMEAIIRRDAFAESVLYLLPHLMDDWGLLRRDGDGWRSTVENLPDPPLSRLQRAWIKALLADPRIGLFLSEEQAAAVSRFVDTAEPLYRQEDFLAYDVRKYGDPYSDSAYRARFQALLQALADGRTVSIAYRSKKGVQREADYLPLRLEYSQLDDKFRLHAACVRGRKAREIRVLNLSRMLDARILDAPPPSGPRPDLDARAKRGEPAVFEIYPQRNAVERCMLHFAHYDKRTEYDETADSYRCTLSYDPNDETELLVELLSFGPVIRVLSPPSLVRQMRERILRQQALLNGDG